MSLQAEVIRFGARFFLKRRSRSSLTIAERRRQLGAYGRWVPRPPANVETIELSIGALPALRIVPPARQPGRHILFLHGGGYIGGSPKLYRHVTWRFAAAGRSELTAINYRLAPEHPFPAAVQDAASAWRALLSEGAAPRHCAVIGDSAGGGLALALALKLRDEKEPMPGAIAALSPWTDLDMTGRSDHGARDPILTIGDLAASAASYLAGSDPCSQYASPVYGVPRGLPPTLLQVGSDEILRDDSVRMAQRMRDAGCNVTLEVWPRMPHVWHLFAPFLPEALRGIARVGAFVEKWAA